MREEYTNRTLDDIIKYLSPVYIRGEFWVPITDQMVPGVKPYYMISDYGRVFSIARCEILTPILDPGTGYLRISLVINGVSRQRSLHRLMMLAFRYFPGCENYQVNHIDGNKLNPSLSNLEWVTCQENIVHAIRTGLHPDCSGENNPFATITNDQADMIGRLLAEGKLSRKEIASTVGCTVSNINNIMSGNCRREVFEKYNLQELKQNPTALTEEQVHFVCKFIQDNRYLYNTESNMYRDIMVQLGIEETKAMVSAIYRIHKRQTRTDISCNYNF